MFLLDAQVERFAVEDVGRVDQRRRVAVRRVARGQGPLDLAGADRIHQPAVAADQIEDRQIGTGLLRVANVVEGGQVAEPLDDLRRIVDEGGSAELPGQLLDANPGDFQAGSGKQRCLHRDSISFVIVGARNSSLFCASYHACKPNPDRFRALRSRNRGCIASSRSHHGRHLDRLRF